MAAARAAALTASVRSPFSASIESTRPSPIATITKKVGMRKMPGREPGGVSVLLLQKFSPPGSRTVKAATNHRRERPAGDFHVEVKHVVAA